ncbi:hypothetical protein MITS9509_01692 [Synechococcus sp. MIT S9509]|uniref:DUF3110 domain-containing protein n=1 Tax=unclassified Synechococcus TaxID=2626047 RepID=UPI0007BB0E65|nr:MULTISPECIES: DUF3110 domain-containing protein [unclassified Synechococcus]KZR87983.1 hypothetical protein MITS9504_00408 [Synechococcus sp. MIT S9504]KZR92232.1 hypothetical protein MITS9509_01692 [Synechococcus sp. MIT S9509]
MLVHVLLYDAGQDSEGIHSLELSGQTVVLMFENRDDADRYAGLLEAQDFPTPSVEALDREEIELFCREAGYEARFVSDGFVPKSDDERLMLAPPSANRDVANWQEQDSEQDAAQAQGRASQDESSVPDLDDVRRRLEGLL